MKLLLFYPENDLALASGKANYTAPAKVVPLRRSGMLLPLWYGGSGDLVCCNGVNARWYDTMRERFGLPVGIFDHQWLPGMEPAPWGWSAASARLMQQQGVPPEALPPKAQLENIRKLSHRRTAALVHGMLAAALNFPVTPPAIECSSTEALKGLLAAGRQFIAKLPWSSSGRGLLDSRKCSNEHFITQTHGMVHSQHSFMLEEAHDKVEDFAMLFECDGKGSCSFTGYSLFETTASGQYSRNLLMADTEIEDRLAKYIAREQLQQTARTLCTIIGKLCTAVYSGPLGIDMLIARRPDGSFILDPVVEINFRMTMGKVAHEFTRRYLQPGVHATFEVAKSDPEAPLPDDYSVENCRLSHGTVSLTPPGGEFSFLVRSVI